MSDELMKRAQDALEAAQAKVRTLSVMPDDTDRWDVGTVVRWRVPGATSDSLPVLGGVAMKWRSGPAHMATWIKAKRAGGVTWNELRNEWLLANVASIQVASGWCDLMEEPAPTPQAPGVQVRRDSGRLVLIHGGNVWMLSSDGREWVFEPDWEPEED